MVPAAGLTTRRRSSRVRAELRRASAVRSADSASSKAFCEPTAFFSSSCARSKVILALATAASASATAARCRSASSANSSAPSVTASPSRTASVSTRPASSGLTKMK